MEIQKDSKELSFEQVCLTALYNVPVFRPAVFRATGSIVFRL